MKKNESKLAAITLSITILLFTVSSLYTFAYATEWTTTQVVSTESTEDSYYPSLAVGSDGTVHIAWYDLTDYGGSGTDTDVFYKRYVPGSGWTVTEVVSTESTHDSYCPSLAVGSDGTVHIAWADRPDHFDFDVFYKRYVPGYGWTTAEVVSTESTDTSSSPSLAVGSDGTVHIAWEDDANYGGSGSDFDVFYKRYVPGSGWTVTEVVSTESTDPSRYPSLAVGSDGTVHIAWEDFTDYGGSGTDTDVFYKRYVPGSGWTTTEIVSTESTDTSSSPSLAVGSDGTVHIAWEDPTDYGGSWIDSDIFYKRYVPGYGWTTTEVVSTEGPQHLDPSLAVGSDGIVHIAWQDWAGYGGSGADWDIFYKTDVRPTPELSLDGVGTWYWTGDTVINSVARGDVDGDGDVEIVTGGYFFDGVRKNAQLCVWDSATLTLENVVTWYWTSDTLIYSVSVGDVDGDGANEIVTGGVDGTSSAQLCVWNGATLALENVKTWRWGSWTAIDAVCIGDVDGDGANEIVTGGVDGTSSAQLCVWNGADLSLENVRTWLWSSFSRVRSVAIGDVDGDGQMEVVTGGHFSNLPDVMGPQNADAQLCVWDGATLSLEGVRTWKWGVNTWINMIAVDDVDGDGEGEVVTGGCYNDGVRDVAQLCVWDGATLSFENVQSWWWTGDTVIESVAVGDVDGDGGVEVVTGGWFWDGSRFNSQLCVWNGDSLGVEDIRTWCWGSGSWIRSVAVGNVDGDVRDEIVTGGCYNDGVRDVAQLCVWKYS